MKTVKQIADELGVSKQAVHQKRKKEPLSTDLQPFTKTVDGVIYISVDGENLIKRRLTVFPTTNLHLLTVKFPVSFQQYLKC